MFRIGEFSKIAQVSGRLLRYYDEISLLTPAHIDPESGYRYYSASQLPRLNRILALKDLDLSLDQIARLVDEAITAEEMRGMLLLKKAQVEQKLREEALRFRAIEVRLEQVETGDGLSDADVVVKSVPAQRFLAIREICATLNEGRQLMGLIAQALPARVDTSVLGYPAGILHAQQFEQENVDVEIGFLVSGSLGNTVELPDGHVLTARELPAVDTMATAVRLGMPQTGFACYHTLGRWMESNGYAFDGAVREIFIELAEPGREDEAVTEVQIPVKPEVLNLPRLT